MSLLWIRCSRNCLELMNRFFECLDPVSWGQFFQVIHVACEGALVRGSGGGHIIPGSATKARKALCIVIISWLHSLSTYMSNKVWETQTWSAGNASPADIPVLCLPPHCGTGSLFRFLTVRRWRWLVAMHWRRQWHPTPVLLPGKSHGRRSLVGCSPWGS